MFWRLLARDPVATRNVVMGSKPPTMADSEQLDSTTLEELPVHQHPRHHLLEGSAASVPRRRAPSTAGLARASKEKGGPSPRLRGRRHESGQPIVADHGRHDAAEDYFKSLSLSDNSGGDILMSPTADGGGGNSYIVCQNVPVLHA